MNAIGAAFGGADWTEQMLECSQGGVETVDRHSLGQNTVGATLHTASLLDDPPVVTSNGILVALDGQFYCYPEDESVPNYCTGRASPGPTDVEILLAAYQRYGTACVEHLVGDFAFVVYDRKTDRLFGARDRTGVRSLYYAETSDGVVLASEIGPLLQHTDADARINERVLKQHLRDRLRTREGTFYRGITQLPAGTALAAEGSEVRRWRYWNPTDGPALKECSEQALVDRFRTLLERVVCSQIDRPKETAVLMSGGLDSTAVGAQAQRCAEEAIPAVSAVFNELHTQDERAKIDAVADYCGIPIHTIPGDDHWPLSAGVGYNAALTGGPRCDMNVPLNAALYRGAADRDRQILFTGIGGNAFDGSRLSYTDRLATGDLSVLAEMVRDPVPTGRLLYWYVFAQFAPRLAQRIERYRTAESRRTETILGPSLRTTIGGADSQAPSLPEPQWDRATRHLWWNDLGVHREFALAAERRLGRSIGVSFRYPLLDARVVEFVFRLPHRHRFRKGGKKHLFRKAMVGKLPEEVRTQSKSVDFSPLAHRGFRARECDRVRSLWASSELVDQGYVDQNEGTRVVEEYLSGDDGLLTEFWQILSAELWLRKISP